MVSTCISYQVNCIFFQIFCEHELSVSIVVHMFLVLLYSAGKNVEKKCYKNVFTNIDSFFWHIVNCSCLFTHTHCVITPIHYMFLLASYVTCL